MARTARILAALGIAGYGAARLVARRIRARPDRYPPAMLRREPRGEQGVLVRPDGTRIRTVVAGSGTPVVLVHGYGASVTEWNIVWERLLANRHRVIAFDQRGHERSTVGRDGVGSASMAGDCLAVLRHFEVRDGVLVGHSMGGFLALRLLLDNPAVARRLRGLVLFASFAGAIFEGSPQNRLQIPLLRAGILQRIAATRTGGTLFGASLSGHDPSPAEIDAFLEVFLRQDHRPITPILKAFGAEDRYPRLGEITVPTVVISGGADRTAPPSHSDRLAAGIPFARQVRVDRKGHLLSWEAPDALVDAIRSFAATAGSPSPRPSVR